MRQAGFLSLLDSGSENNDHEVQRIFSPIEPRNQRQGEENVRQQNMRPQQPDEPVWRLPSPVLRRRPTPDPRDILQRRAAPIPGLQLPHQDVVGLAANLRNLPRPTPYRPQGEQAQRQRHDIMDAEAQRQREVTSPADPHIRSIRQREGNLRQYQRQLDVASPGDPLALFDTQHDVALCKRVVTLALAVGY